jgi:hypothetical protein
VNRGGGLFSRLVAPLIGRNLGIDPNDCKCFYLFGNQTHTYVLVAHAAYAEEAAVPAV